jgi:hypothetical protein
MAERLFAVLRQNKRLYPAMTIGNLGKLANSLVNATHRPEMYGKAAGVALTADARLRDCINRLCSVRRVKVRVLTVPYHPSIIHLIAPFP